MLSVCFFWLVPLPAVYLISVLYIGLGLWLVFAGLCNGVMLWTSNRKIAGSIPNSSTYDSGQVVDS